MRRIFHKCCSHADHPFEVKRGGKSPTAVDSDGTINIVPKIQPNSDRMFLDLPSIRIVNQIPILSVDPFAYVQLTYRRGANTADY